MKNKLLKIFGIIVSIAIFPFIGVNEDSIYRMDIANNVNLFNFDSIRIIFSEPFSLLIAVFLKKIGLSDPFFFQLTLFLIILYCLSKIIKRRMYLFPVILFIPAINLLSFNIQPMMISLLIIYYILDLEKINDLSYRKTSLLFLLAVMFHWSALLLTPFLLIRLGFYKTFFFLGVITINASLSLFILDDINVKLLSYTEAKNSISSIVHVYSSLLLALFFVLLNIFFRKNNAHLTSSNYLYIYLGALAILIINIVGYKAASRFVFILDLFLIIDLIRYWLPTKIFNQKIYFHKIYT